MCVTLSGLEKFFYFSRDFFFFNYFSRYFSIKNEIILLTISGELIKIESPGYRRSAGGPMVVEERLVREKFAAFQEVIGILPRARSFVKWSW